LQDALLLVFGVLCGQEDGPSGDLPFAVDVILNGKEECDWADCFSSPQRI
jgi:hypothetical protein